MTSLIALRSRRLVLALAVLPILLSACGTAGSPPAKDISFGNVLPGGSMVKKRMVSLRAARFTNLVPQRTDFSCGAAAVATILKYAYGLEDADEQQVLQEMLKYADKEVVFRKGFSLLDIKTFVQSLGMKAVGFEIEAEHLERIKVPVIVLLDIKGYKHFVVFKTARRDRVYLADPALGNKVMTRQAFVESWNGIALAIVADFYNEDTVLARARGPASARQLLTRRAPVIDAPALDFGLTHIDLLSF